MQKGALHVIDAHYVIPLLEFILLPFFFSENTFRVESEIPVRWDELNIQMRHIPIFLIPYDIYVTNIWVVKRSSPEELSEILLNKSIDTLWSVTKKKNLIYYFRPFR